MAALGGDAARLPEAVRVAVCFIDLDSFKAVIDRLGHAAGDRLLQMIAQRPQDAVRGNDTEARLGGDEFVVLLTHLPSREEARQVLARVVEAIREPVDVGHTRSARRRSASAWPSARTTATLANGC